MNQANQVDQTEATLATSIGSITEPTILAYFQTFNAHDFQATASLFAAEGQLMPPFESAIVGQDAIFAYLETEAQGMAALPQGIQEDLSSATSINVVGKVQTRLFTVNVNWQFVLNSESEILSLKIKLLAALQDLLHLKR